MSHIQENLNQVRHAIAQAAIAAGRNPEEVKLIAVSKTFPPECVAQAVAAGQFCFGENRVQEAAAKIPAVAVTRRLEWHLVGHLQSNKARKAAALFDWVHSVDSLAILARLNESAKDCGKILPVLIQVDLAKEPTKSGIDPQELEPLLIAAAGFSSVSIQGLMVLPPYLPDAEEVRPYFRSLRELRDAMASHRLPSVNLVELSMGMSHDFAIAIQEGATMIRVGTAIFGARSQIGDLSLGS